MHSRRVLGAIALGAVVIAAISFAVVDVSIAGANGCVGTASPCADRDVPVVAITFAALGVLALLVSILPAVTWIVEVFQQPRSPNHQADVEVARSAMRRRLVPADDDDEL